MAVWTTGSARRTNTFWILVKRLLSRRDRPATMRVDDLPEAQSRDLAVPQQPLPKPASDLWARIAAGKLPRL